MRLYHILLPFGTKLDFNSPTTNTTLYTAYIDKVQYQCAAVELPSVDILYGTNMLEATIDCDFSYQNSAPIYYYHPDHLGLAGPPTRLCRVGERRSNEAPQTAPRFHFADFVTQIKINIMAVHGKEQILQKI